MLKLNSKRSAPGKNGQENKTISVRKGAKPNPFEKDKENKVRDPVKVKSTFFVLRVERWKMLVTKK